MTSKTTSSALAGIGKFFNLPTILTTSFDGGPNGPLVPELIERITEAPFIRRPGQINAWGNEDFVKAVKATGRKQWLIACVVTDVCVASRPCRHWKKVTMYLSLPMPLAHSIPQFSTQPGV
jgi:hypothetical protein